MGMFSCYRIIDYNYSHENRCCVCTRSILLRKPCILLIKTVRFAIDPEILWLCLRSLNLVYYDLLPYLYECDNMTHAQYSAYKLFVRERQNFCRITKTKETIQILLGMS